MQKVNKMRIENAMQNNDTFWSRFFEALASLLGALGPSWEPLGIDLLSHFESLWGSQINPHNGPENKPIFETNVERF